MNAVIQHTERAAPPVKSIVREGQDIALAIELIGLGARLQVLEQETRLSRDRLTRLYKEIKRASPPKGMLPFSVDWFMTWQPNIHASLFYALYRGMVKHYDAVGIDAAVRSYKLYLEHGISGGDESLLSFTRAWTLIRYFESDMLRTAPCTRCGGEFVAHAHDPVNGYVCGLCRPPARAGKTSAKRRPMPARAPRAAHPVHTASAHAAIGHALRPNSL